MARKRRSRSNPSDDAPDVTDDIRDDVAADDDGIEAEADEAEEADEADDSIETYVDEYMDDEDEGFEDEDELIDTARRLHVWQIQAVRDAFVFLAAFGLVYAGYAMRSITVPLLVALMLAYLFEPVVSRMSRGKWFSREGAVVTILCSAILAIVVVGAIILPLLVTQTLDLMDNFSSGKMKQQMVQLDSYIPDRYTKPYRELVDQLPGPDAVFDSADGEGAAADSDAAAGAVGEDGEVDGEGETDEPDRALADSTPIPLVGAVDPAPAVDDAANEPGSSDAVDVSDEAGLIVDTAAADRFRSRLDGVLAERGVTGAMRDLIMAELEPDFAGLAARSTTKPSLTDAEINELAVRLAAANAATNAGAGNAPLYVYPPNGTPYAEAPGTNPATDSGRLIAIARSTLRTVFRFIGGVIEISLLLFLIPFYFFFFSVAYPKVRGFFATFIPKNHHSRVVDLIGQMDRVVAGFVRGRIVISLILGVLYAVGWYACGVPYAVPIGIATGILSIVPYLGGIGWPVAVLLLLIDQFAGTGDERMSVLWIILGPTIVFFVVQLIEGYVLTPMIAGKATNLDPVTIVVAVLAGGSLLGIYGMLLAIPVFACAKIVIKEIALPAVYEWLRGERSDPLPIGVDDK